MGYNLNGLKALLKYNGTEIYTKKDNKQTTLHKFLDRDGNEEKFTLPSEFVGEIGSYYTCEFTYRKYYIKSTKQVIPKLVLLSAEPVKTKTTK